MGNSESSSSHLPSHGSNQDPDQSKKKKGKATEDETSSARKVLMTGAALTGTALLAIGAWSLSSSSSSSEPTDSKAQKVGISRITGAQQERHFTPIPIFNHGSYSRLIKIMSYNVWFRDDVEVHKRMGAIGQLVQEHSPDVILFQEVTPLVYQLFQSSQWWKLYKCFVPREKETRKHFRMLLSKMPARGLCFEKSVTGREINAAEIYVGSNYKPLVVANCHLKSPNLPLMNSNKRRAQAEEALMHLGVYSNAIIGGDMNWNEDSDGQFPLHGAWIDAWAQVRPTENGWTFDTEANRSLQDNPPLQKRLDRFICKLRDFEIADIEMIGMEAIPEISYRPKMKENPVYPSDHFGLLLTISTV